MVAEDEVERRNSSKAMHPNGTLFPQLGGGQGGALVANAVALMMFAHTVMHVGVLSTTLQAVGQGK